MNGRRRRPAQRRAGIGMAVALAVIAILLIALAVRLVSGAFSVARKGGSGGTDPQFAEPAETVTRPPELEGEGRPDGTDADPSVQWEEVELTPVDKTAEELGREEEAED